MYAGPASYSESWSRRALKVLGRPIVTFDMLGSFILEIWITLL